MEPSGGGFQQRFPPLISSGGSLLSLCFWFCVSPPPLSGKCQGTIFLVLFRSRGCFRTKNRRKRGHEGQNRWAHAAKVPGRVGPPFCPSGLRSLTYFAPRSSSFQNNGPAKFIAHLDVVWVPESQKHGKRGFLVLQG